MVLHIYMASFDLMATDESTDVNSGAADGNRDDLISEENYAVFTGDCESEIKTRMGSGRAKESDQE